MWRNLTVTPSNTVTDEFLKYKDLKRSADVDEEVEHGLYSNGNAVPLQAWFGPEGSRKLRFPDFMITAQDGSKVVSLTHRPPLP